MEGECRRVVYEYKGIIGNSWECLGDFGEYFKFV